MSKKPKAKTGRPSAYREEYPELARKFCLLGATNDQLAQLLGVGTTTIDNWIRDKAEFADAVKAGRAVADATVADSLYRRATGYSHPATKFFQFEGKIISQEYTEQYPPDATSMIFWLKNRRPDLWRDKVEHEHNDPARRLSDEKLEAAIGVLRAMVGKDDEGR